MDQATSNAASEQAAQVYQARLNATPAVEARDGRHDARLRQHEKEYQDLLAKKQEISSGHQLGNAAARRAVPVIDPPSLAR